MDKRRLIILIPGLALLLALLIGGIYSAQASSAGDFNVVDGVLYSYNGTDAKLLIPDSVEKVANSAFEGNSFIQELSFSPSVTEIGDCAFKNCTALRSVSIPDSVTKLGDSAFWGCPLLSSVSLGAGLRDFGCGVFSDCESLGTVILSSANTYLTVSDSAIFNKEMTRLYQYLDGALYGSYGVPGNVEFIDRYAFWGADRLQAVSVPGMKQIPDYAFAGCPNLRSVVLQIPTYEICVKAFSGCPNLAQVVMPESVGRIHETAFDDCPENMYFICDLYSYAQRYADEHFYPTAAAPVYEVVVETMSPEQILKADEPAVSGNVAPPVGSEAMAEYAGEEDPQHDGLRVTYDGVVLGNSPVVADRAYVQMPGSDFTVHDGSETPSPAAGEDVIPDHAHYLDQTLTSYDFPANTKEIGDFAFARTNLNVLNLPEGVTSIGEGAFYHCDQLSEVNIPSTVTHIGKNALNYTPWYSAWFNDENSDKFLIVGDGVLIAVKGDRPETLPSTVKHIADGVFE
ncbi:MAG: leucine-rich repeat domain-containing protein [Lachnospiraceae bacterium]|nr:leucine-rich repeat domain-containing protein [Lachnospiraceae bacterium]